MTTTRLPVDLHLHSRYSMGTSPSLDLPALAEMARRKGIGLLAAPDYTHPDWLAEMKASLREEAPGTYTAHGATFILVTELSCVFAQGGRGRRLHLLVAAPSVESAEALAGKLSQYQDLRSDGRPMLGLSAKQLAELAWSIDESFEVIPAHIWTPWYGLLGSRSGFDSLDECFGDAAPRIHAIETGLSSDPAMNWGVPAIGNRSIVSFSDAHSLPTMGRELTVLDAEPTYESVVGAIRDNRIVETIEFHPEHGKYHMDGHRKCGVRMTPDESARLGGRCPSCGRKMTLGVLNRISKLADRNFKAQIGNDGLRRSPDGRPPFRSLVPLRELISFALGVGPSAKKVFAAYSNLTDALGGELEILTTMDTEQIGLVGGEPVASAIQAVRDGNVDVVAGFDGQYGTVHPSKVGG